MLNISKAWLSSWFRILWELRHDKNKESCEWMLSLKRKKRKRKWNFFVRLFGNGVSERRQGDRRTPASSPTSVAAVRSTPSSTSQQQQQSQQSQQSQPNPANPPTSPSSQPLSLQELTVRTITMTRDPPDSHGFGICVKGGKDAGEIRSTFRLPPSPYFAPQDRGIFRKLWLSLPFVARRSLLAAVVLDSHRIAIRKARFLYLSLFLPSRSSSIIFWTVFCTFTRFLYFDCNDTRISIIQISSTM